MDFKQGDRVKAVNEKAEGKVVGLDKRGYILVEVEGFEIPYLPTQIVKVDVEEYSFQISSANLYNPIFKVGEKVFLVDDNSTGSVVKVLHSNKIRVLIDGFEYDYPASKLMTHEHPDMPGTNFTVEEKLHDFKENHAKRHVKKEGAAAPIKNKRNYVRRNDHGVLEIDLHIYELVDDYRHMANADMMIIQLDRFQRAFDEAVLANERHVVIIHGKGAGVLKTEIRRILAGYPKIRYFDAPFRRYGFGATEVTIY